MSFLAPLLAALVSVAPPPVGEGLTPRETVPREVGLRAPLATSELRTARFRIVHTAAAKGPAEYLAAQIEGIRDEVARTIGHDWPGITEVRLGFGREEYEALALEHGPPPSWAVALAYPTENIVLVEAHSLIQGDGQVTLRHELVHVGLGQLGKDWPRWFQEGLAQELTGERRYRLEQYAALARAVAIERVFPFHDLKWSFPSRPEDVEIAYAQSAAYVGFLKERHGAAGFTRLIDEMQGGADFDSAFFVAFQASQAVEERAFRQELSHRYPWWPLLVAGGTSVWALMGLLVVVAWVKRNRQKAVRRAEMIRVEHMEDLARLIALKASAPDNDERSLEEWLLPPSAPWNATSVTRHRVPGAEDAAPQDREPASRGEG